ncbi:MAG: serine/threonine protein kinase [Planctomycetes bacterium]|nr:serine/threonine protein kinase [Planctomycetota bacterium]
MGEIRNEQSFGQLVVKQRLASTTQVEECLAIQNKMKSMGLPARRLGDIMVEKGYLSKDQASGISRQQQQATAAAPVQIAGYELLAKVGQGGMGAVYRARQLSMDRIVALKILPRHLAKDPAFVERFIREARAVARLNHENIIQGIDVGEAGGVHYFVMEYIEGCTVNSLLKKDGALPEAKALEITLQIARALEHAHKNALVHRDVKPENMMLTKDGVAKLCDLGLAKQVTSDSSLTQDGTSVGTPHYIAPEQARGEHQVDIRADLYSLGASLYHMLVGVVPFEGPNATVVMTKHLTDEPVAPNKIRPAISDAANAITLKLMAKKAADRYQTPAELMEDLDAALRRRPVGALKNLAATTGARRRPGGAGGPAAVPGPGGSPGPGGVTRLARDRDRDRDSDSTVRRRAEFGARPSDSKAGLYAVIGGLVIALVAALRFGVSERPPQPTPGPDPGVKPPIVEPDPGGGNPPPVNPGPGTDPAADSRRKKAFEYLDAIGAVIIHAGDNPDELMKVNERFDEFFQEFKNTQFEVRGLDEQAKFKERLEGFAAKWMIEREVAAAELERKGQLEEAIGQYTDLAPVFRETAAAKRAQQRISDLRDIQKQRFADCTTGADQAAAAGDFSKAIALIETIARFGSADMKREATGRLAKLKPQQEKFTTDKRAAALAEYEQKLLPEFEGLLRAGQPERAFKLMEEARERDPFKWSAEILTADRTDAQRLVDVKADAQAGLAEAARAGLEVEIGKAKGKVIAQDKERYALETVERRVTMAVPIDLDKLGLRELVRLAELRREALGESPEWQMKKGLVEFWVGDRKDARAPFEAAAALYEKILDVASAQRARGYLERIGAGGALDAAERAARELLGKARGAAREKRFDECRRALGELRDKYGTTAAVRDAAKELADLEGLCAKAGVGGAGGAPGPRFNVPGTPSAQHPGYTQWLYDFSKREQLNDWRTNDVMKQMLYNEAKKTVRIEDAQWFWNGALKGDAWIEVRFVTPKKTNIALTLCDSARFSLSESRCYYIGYNVEEMPLVEMLTPEARQFVARTFTSPHRMLKFDYTKIAARRLPEALIPLGVQNEPIDPQHKNCQFQVAMTGGKLTCRLVVGGVGNMDLEGVTSPDLDAGHFSLCFVKSEAELTRVTIVGRVTEGGGEGK